MEILHYAIIIIVISCIIVCQFYFYNKNKQKQNELQSIFPKDCESSLSHIVELEDENTQIESTHSNPVFDSINKTINGYLKENKGAASDFHLIKDVVERHCDTVEDEIATLTPIPLYCGLIGTMLGILIGVGIMVFTGGVEALLSTTTTESNSGIVELLGGVSLAMISSIIGIFLTTKGSYQTKEAKNILNANKNSYLSWIQIKLLPTLAGNTTSAIYTLQNNLSAFNRTFSSNIKEMSSTFASIKRSHKDQLELMQLVERMDVTKIAKANITVLEELQKSVKEFERFNVYMQNVGNYIEKVERLNSEINDHLNRTKVIEDMGAFFKDEIQQIEQRKGVINQIVGSVDATLLTAIKKLQDNTEKQLNEFIQYSVIQQDRFAKTINEQNDQYNKVLTEQQFSAKKALENQEEIVKSKLKETTALIEELKNLSAVKSTMSNIEKATNEQTRKFSDLIAAIEKIARSSNNSSSFEPSLIPNWVFIGAGFTMAILSIAGLLHIVPILIEQFKN